MHTSLFTRSLVCILLCFAGLIAVPSADAAAQVEGVVRILHLMRKRAPDDLTREGFEAWKKAKEVENVVLTKHHMMVIIADLSAGIVVTRDGLIATSGWSDDAIRSAGRDDWEHEFYVAYLNRGAAEISKAAMTKNDKGVELALLRVQNLSLPPLKLNIGKLEKGDALTAIYFSDGDEDSPEGREQMETLKRWVEDGCTQHISAPPSAMVRFLKPITRSTKLIREVTMEPSAGRRKMPLIEHEANISISDQGAPLLNSAGHVIGMHVFSGSRFSRLSMQIRSLHDLLQSGGHAHRWTESGGPQKRALVGLSVGAALLVTGGLVIVLKLLQTQRQRQFPIPQYQGAGNMVPAMNDLSGMRDKGVPQPPSFPDHGARSIIDNRSRFVPGAVSRWIDRRRGRSEQIRGDAATSLRSNDVRRGSTYHSYELAPMESPGRPVELAERDFAQQNGRLIIGRSTELAHIFVEERNISNRHAAFRIRDGGLYVEDLESSNGTRVNGKRLEPFQDTPVSIGDTITLGSVTFRVRQART